MRRALDGGRSPDHLIQEGLVIAGTLSSDLIDQELAVLLFVLLVDSRQLCLCAEAKDICQSIVVCTEAFAGFLNIDSVDLGDSLVCSVNHCEPRNTYSHTVSFAEDP